MREVLSAPAQQPVPDTYKFGFAASTGLFTDVHLIRNVAITTDEPLPELNLVKQVEEPLPSDLTAGAKVTYEFVVTNGGASPVTHLAVHDHTVGPVTCPVERLDGGQTVTCKATYVITQADVERGHIINTGRANDETVTSPEDSHTLPIRQQPSLIVVKQVHTRGPYRVGQRVEYKYTVINTGGHPLSDIRIVDDRATDIRCGRAELTPGGTAGDTTICRGSYVITMADEANGIVTNRAHALGETGGATITSPPAEATLTLSGPARIAIRKRIVTRGPYRRGRRIRYDYRVSSTGKRRLHHVLVTDDVVRRVICRTTALAPGAHTICTGTYKIAKADARAGRLTNRGQAVGTDPRGTTVISRPAKVTIRVRRPHPNRCHCRCCRCGHKHRR